MMSSESSSMNEPAGNVTSSGIDWDTLAFPLYANVHIRPNLERPSVIRSLQSEWLGEDGEEDLERFQIEIITAPFRVCIAEEFLFDDDFVGDLVRDVSALNVKEKASDLFKLKQSSDLSTIQHPEAKTLLRFLKDECRLWLQTVTGFELSERVDATFSLYSPGDYLLCHDDKCENRKIAFILYCNKKYLASNGGALVFYDTDGNGNPKGIVNTIYPRYNKFVFFEVSDKSFHRVQDVCYGGRLSVNGWFYSKEPAPPAELQLPPPAAEEINYFIPSRLNKADFNAILNKRYLREDIKRQLRSHFEFNSESMLHDFVAPWTCFTAARDLDSATGWVRQGPLHRRCFDVLPHSELECLPRLTRVLQVFKSRHMFDLLSQLTGISSLAAAENPRCLFEIQRWTGGYYSMISDLDTQPARYALEVILFLQGRTEGEGCGQVVYIDSDDGAQLLSISPVQNGLGLTYRDSHTHRFVRYLTSYNNSHNYYAVFFTYLENAM